MRINCDYTFQNYLVSDNNKGAIEAISSAMALPGQIHNPLFIYGPVGVGKTHLLQAIAHEYTSASKIYYTTIEDFVNDIIHAIQHRRYVDFIERCLNLDALLIDDVHLVKDKKFTLGELLSILGRLYKAEKQIVLSADKPPRQIFNTKTKAFKMFQAGLVLKIEPPAYNDRLRFLQARARNTGLSFDNDIFEDLASTACPDFRELAGALAKTKFSSTVAPFRSINLTL